MGRWTSIRINGQQKRSLVIITIYRVPKNTISTAGPNTSFFAQWHHLRNTTNQTPNAREQILQDISTYITQISDPKLAILVMIDANESYLEHNLSLLRWIQQHSLVDVHQYLHSLGLDIPTYARGKRRIDYMFCSSTLTNYLLDGGILSYHFFFKTN